MSIIINTEIKHNKSIQFNLCNLSKLIIEFHKISGNYVKKINNFTINTLLLLFCTIVCITQ